ncbi:RidA family protein [Auraticoccus monumenti]|uniref:Enamine deaminase RidA, house cleaning of reactive enamine intermediates, YjgF/YER057c/UK114 family n=1 Tax=Auraticoccus monumenti TaxID=675864 RepID=A0A1G6S2R1_9ACTN|nr:RidA family protein [Auraticoccus monumenti]SDD11202.1 Enamine deaminase RidA, house cleaning of reactive enamine intermediates, YjgF/YER057c/UK114 family [Auraticoccus monumenti]
MTTPSSRLTELGLTLPAVAAPLAAYVPATRVGNQVWTSGQLPVVDGALAATGKVGGAVTTEHAAELARTCALNGLAAAAEVAGGIDRVARVLKAVVYVASEPSFTGQPAVGNGASELLGQVFGESGRHVRSAVGVSVLPLDAPVEVELVLELAPDA